MSSAAASASTVSSSVAAVGAARKYKFYRSDFGPLEAKPLHLDLYFDVLEQRVVVTNHTTFMYVPAAGLDSSDTLRTLRLNAKDLEISSVERVTDFLPLAAFGAGGRPDFPLHVASFANPTTLKHSLDADEALLTIELDEPVKAGAQFVLRIVTIAQPTAHILEGLYYDYTPAGCPRTIITQCQPAPHSDHHRLYRIAGLRLSSLCGL